MIAFATLGFLLIAGVLIAGVMWIKANIQIKPEPTPEVNHIVPADSTPFKPE
jgi:hypothetical protein